jgi:hypothetical protein
LIAAEELCPDPVELRFMQSRPPHEGIAGAVTLNSSFRMEDEPAGSISTEHWEGQIAKENRH